MAIAFVESQVKDSGVSPAITAAFTASIGVGQLLVAFGGLDGGATGLMTGVTDSKGNTWTHVPGMDIANGGGTLALDAWYCVPTTGGTSFSVNVAFNDVASNCNAVVQYFNGFVGTPTLDKVQHSSNTSSTTATSGATAATTQATELVVGGVVHAGVVSAYTLGAGYTNLADSSVANREAGMESKLVSSTGAQTATFTIAAPSVNIGGVVTFYDPSAAPYLPYWKQPTNQPLRNRIRPRQQPPSFKNIPPARASQAPYVPYWKQPVNQPLRNRIRPRQQPDYNILPPPGQKSQAPYLSYWVHLVNQSLRNRIRPRQQPPSTQLEPFYAVPIVTLPSVASWRPPTNQPLRRRGKVLSISGGAISSTTQPPYLSYWVKPVNQPVRRKPQRQPIYSQQEPFYGIAAAATVLVSQFMHPINQFLRSRTPKRQQVNRALPNPPRGSAAPYISYWVQPVNQFLKSRVLKRQIPGKYQPPYPAAASQAPYVSYWKQPINQFLKSRTPKRQQPPPVRVTMPPGAYSTPSLAAWVHPVNQFLKSRVLKRQTPKYPVTIFYVQEPGLMPTDWIHPVNQPLRSRVLKRLQVNKFEPPYPPLASAPIYLSYWIHPVNQFLRSRVPKRQQPVRKISPNPLASPIVLPKGWIPQVQQFLRSRLPKRQQPNYTINRGGYDPIPNVPPQFGTFGIIISTTDQLGTLSDITSTNVAGGDTIATIADSLSTAPAAGESSSLSIDDSTQKTTLQG